MSILGLRIFFSLGQSGDPMSDASTTGLPNEILLQIALNSIYCPYHPSLKHRIVAKVDELMALCDELEAQLANTATTRRKLLEATLHEAL